MRPQLIAYVQYASHCVSLFFFFNDTATTEIYTLSLHDALPISRARRQHERPSVRLAWLHHLTMLLRPSLHRVGPCLHARDRKSTRLNSSHLVISYAVFCLKKKKNNAYRIARHTNPSSKMLAGLR